MKLFTVNWNGGIIPSGDTSSWDAAANSCFNTAPQFIAFNPTLTPPQPLSVAGAKGSSGDPNSDGNRRATGQVAGVVFGS
jgi:hypothetical protein